MKKVYSIVDNYFLAYHHIDRAYENRALAEKIIKILKKSGNRYKIEDIDVYEEIDIDEAKRTEMANQIEIEEVELN